MEFRACSFLGAVLLFFAALPPCSVYGAPGISEAPNASAVVKVGTGMRRPWVDVRDFGADPSGTADSTVAIQAAIDNTTSGTIYLPSGTYVVTPAKHGVALRPHGDLSFVGDGMGKTTIKVMDGAGEYKAVFSQTNTVGNMLFRDFSIDSNVAKNPLTRGILKHPRYSIEASYGQNTILERVEFRNTSDVNTVVIGGTEALVANCVFRNVGSDPFRHDHSTLYIHAERARVLGNVFDGAGVSSNGAVTAIETHGGEQIVANNIINGYWNGANITGIDHKGDSTNIVVANNTFKNVRIGVHVWSGKYRTHVAGYGINGLTISGNTFLMKESGARDSFSLAAVEFEPNNNLPIKNVAITGNTITYDLSIPPSHHDQEYLKSGIAYYSTQSPLQVLENLNISNNTIVGPPASGIFLHCGLKNALISNNLIRNVGADNGAMHKSGVWISGDGTEIVQGVDVNGNQITDTRDTAQMKTGIQFNYIAAAEDLSAVHNTIRAYGADTSAFIYYYYVASPKLRPYVVGKVENIAKVHVGGSGVYKNGSRITDTTTGRIYTYIADKGKGGFRSISYASSPPTGSSIPAKVGDIVYNTGPGKVILWKCVGSGTPGKWSTVSHR